MKVLDLKKKDTLVVGESIFNYSYENLLKLNNKNLNERIVNLHILILILTFIYGAVTGFFLGGMQILINSIKIPIIILSLVYISLPVFIGFNLFVKKNINIKHMMIIILSGFAISVIIMAAFAPVLLLFCSTTTDVSFIVLLNTGIGSLALFCGIFYIYRIFSKIKDNGNEYASLIMGIFIILFSAPQLIWALKPYFHGVHGFVEPIKSNFYVEILKIAQSHPLLTIVLVLIFVLVGVIIIFNLCINNEQEQKKKICLKKNDIIIEGTQKEQVNKNHHTYAGYYQYPYYYPPYYYGHQTIHER